MDRIILHCDLNCFYASVELLSHPDLRDIPTAVCGDPQSRHGIILAKNEPAKKFGVQTAETIWQAKKKCPDLVLLPPHHDLYREYSRKVNAIYDEYTDLVEPFGIDESWLDVTNTLHLFGGDAKALADTLRERMKRELGLTLSVGVSFNNAHKLYLFACKLSYSVIIVFKVIKVYFCPGSFKVCHGNSSLPSKFKILKLKNIYLYCNYYKPFLQKMQEAVCRIRNSEFGIRN